MESGTLPLTSPSQRILSEKLRYPCFSQVPAGSDCPLPCLYCISRYNSLIVTVLLFAGLLVPAGSDCSSFMPILHQSLHLIGFYSSLLRKFASTGGLRLPSFMPILHLSLQFIDCYSPSLRRFSQVSGSDCPLFKAYRVNIAPYYLFTLKNTFHYRKLYDIRVFV